MCTLDVDFEVGRAYVRIVHHEETQEGEYRRSNHLHSEYDILRTKSRLSHSELHGWIIGQLVRSQHH